MAIPDRPPRIFSARFAVDGTRSRGRDADVLNAVDRVTGQRVAIKVAHHGDAHAHARLAAEVRVCESLRHSTVPPVVAAHLEGPVPYAVFAYAHGAPPTAMRLTTRAVREMAIDLLSLAHLVDHADVEHPHLEDHVLVDSRGRTRVVGWGAARPARPGACERTAHATGTALLDALLGERACDDASPVDQIVDSAPAAVALDPALVQVIDNLLEPDSARSSTPLALLHLLGQAGAASPLGPE